MSVQRSEVKNGGRKRERESKEEKWEALGIGETWWARLEFSGGRRPRQRRCCEMRQKE